MPQPRGVAARRQRRRPDRRRHRPDRRDRQAVHRRARAHARRQADHRDGPPAVRPDVARLAQDRVPPGRRARPRRRRRARRGRRRRRPPRVHRPRRQRRARATSTSRARATSSRPPSTRASSGSSTRRRSPPTASTTTTRCRSTEDVADARHRGAPLQRAEGRARARARRGRSTGAKLDAYVFRPCIVAGPDARMLIDAIPYVQIGEALPGAVRAAVRPGADPQAGHPRPRRAVPARPPRRRRAAR